LVFLCLLKYFSLSGRPLCFLAFWRPRVLASPRLNIKKTDCGLRRVAKKLEKQVRFLPRMCLGSGEKDSAAAGRGLPSQFSSDVIRFFACDVRRLFVRLLRVSLWRAAPCQPLAASFRPCSWGKSSASSEEIDQMPRLDLRLVGRPRLAFLKKIHFSKALAIIRARYPRPSVHYVLLNRIALAGHPGERCFRGFVFFPPQFPCGPCGKGLLLQSQRVAFPARHVLGVTEADANIRILAEERRSCAPDGPPFICREPGNAHVIPEHAKKMICAWAS